MVIDHINAIWLHHGEMLMGLVGRGTFPLFCYAVAAAVLKVKNSSLPPEERKKSVRRYLIRLLVLALAAQPFYFFALGGNTVNVIFTLALGIVFAALSFRARLWQMYALYTAALFSMLWTLPLEFGLAGVMLPSAIVLVQRGYRSAWPFLILLLLFINAGGALEGLEAHVSPLVWAYVALNGLFSSVLPWLVLDTANRLQQRGRFLPKYALHVFYPAHLAILKLLGLAFF